MAAFDEKNQSWLTILVLASLVLTAVVVFYIITLARMQKQQVKTKRSHRQMRKKFNQRVHQAGIHSVEQERKRIAEDLHDNIGSSLAAIKLHLFALRGSLKAHPTAALISQVEDTINDLSFLTRGLHPEAVAGQHLCDLLESLAARMSRSGRKQVRFSGSGDRLPLGPEEKLALYRVMQELLTNSVKYARCDAIHISIHYAPEQVELVYREENSAGYIPSSSLGLGLKNIESRLKALPARYEHIYSAERRITGMKITRSLEPAGDPVPGS